MGKYLEKIKKFDKLKLKGITITRKGGIVYASNNKTQIIYSEYKLKNFDTSFIISDITSKIYDIENGTDLNKKLYLNTISKKKSYNSNSNSNSNIVIVTIDDKKRKIREKLKIVGLI